MYWSSIRRFRGPSQLDIWKLRSYSCSRLRLSRIEAASCKQGLNRSECPIQVHLQEQAYQAVFKGMSNNKGNIVDSQITNISVKITILKKIQQVLTKTLKMSTFFSSSFSNKSLNALVYRYLRGLRRIYLLQYI